jgi:hypothetical protein
MGLIRRLDALMQATRAAHAALRVYGSEPEVEPYSPQSHLDARHLWRTRRIVRIPAADSLPNTYECPACLTGFEAGLDQRVDRMLQGAVDAGNGDVFDRLIDQLAAKAHCELRVEHSLRASTAQLLVMRNRGDAARVPAQLADVEGRLAANERECAELPEGDRWRPRHRERAKATGRTKATPAQGTSDNPVDYWRLGEPAKQPGRMVKAGNEREWETGEGSRHE